MSGQLALIAIMKNEGHIIEEWVGHYLSEGVERFFLIDNGSTDNTVSKLKPFMEAGVVELSIDARRHAQTSLYNKYCKRKSRSYEWVIVCDLDEFIYARGSFDTIASYLASLPADVGSVCVPWKLFGSNGHHGQPPCVREGFIRRALYDGRVNHGMLNSSTGLCKMICRGPLLKKLGVHVSKLRSTHCITPDGRPGQIESPFQRISEGSLADSALHLNHYAIQSLDWFREVKMTRGSADRKANDHIRDQAYFDGFDYDDLLDMGLAEKSADHQSPGTRRQDGDHRLV